MAKRRKRSIPRARKRAAPRRARRRSARRAPSAPVRRRRRSGGGSGLGGGWVPAKPDLMDIAGAGVYGFLEKTARADKTHFLNKVPHPVPQLGFAGNTALGVWVVAKLTKQPLLKHLFKGAASVAVYQMVAQGSLFEDGDEKFVVSGYGDTAAMLDEKTVGALAAVGGLDEMAGLPLEAEAANAGAHD
jgi:hypothetical protein